MKERVKQSENQLDVLNIFRETLRMLTAMIGLCAIVCGLTIALNLFNTIRRVLVNPEENFPVIEKWAELVGGEEVTLQLGSGAIPLDNLTAILVVGGGTFMLVLIALSFVSVGAKIISLTLTDVETMKKIVSDFIKKTSNKQEEQQNN